MSIEPFIGTKISLISKLGIRYEGSLHSLNTDDSTIVLNDVRCMGTEGRSKDNEVPPSSKVHDFVVFRGDDISDIVVNENNPPPEEPAFEDPAIFKTYKKDEFKKPSPAQPQSFKNSSLLREVGIAATRTENDFAKPSSSDRDDPLDTDKPQDKDLESFKFDFDEDTKFSVNDFNKPLSVYNSRSDSTLEDSSSQRKDSDSQKNEFKVFYDKKSFYDNLSHEKQLTKNDLKQEQMKQREIDMATFGKFSLRNWHNRNHSNRGRRFNNSKQSNVKAGWEKNNFPNN